MKVSELQGAKLDYWVAKALGAKKVGIEKDTYGLQLDMCFAKFEDFGFEVFAPSINWSEGGPIIERERIKLIHISEGKPIWHAGCKFLNDGNEGIKWQFGSTALIAAMRVFVASKLGEKVTEFKLPHKKK